MSTLTIRNLDESLKATLRLEAARRGHSMEQEAREILKRALSGAGPRGGLGKRVHARFASLGGVELEPPVRRSKARPARLRK
jgi:plasmid stability protein